MATPTVGDQVWYRGNMGAPNAEGVIQSRRGLLVGLTGTTAHVRWTDHVNDPLPVVDVPLANLVRVEDVLPQGETVAAPRPPTHGAPYAL